MSLFPRILKTLATTGAVAWAGGAGALAEAPAAWLDALAAVSLERRPGAGGPDCALAVSVRNTQPAVVVARLFEVQHLFAGELRQERIVVVPSRGEQVIGCSWYKGARAPTDYTIVGAAFVPRPAVEAVAEVPVDEDLPEDLPSCAAPAGYQPLKARELAERGGWYSGLYVAVSGKVVAGEVGAWSALLFDEDGAFIELAGRSIEPVVAGDDAPRVVWGLWRGAGRSGRLEVVSYCRE